jgi:hypothetical protein
MHWLGNFARRYAALLFALACLLAARTAYCLPGKDKPNSPPPTVRWEEGQPGCTFSKSDDGKYRYGLWSGDVGVILAVDAREMQIIRRRTEPFLALMLTVRYRGNQGLDVGLGGITLQFMKHFKVTQPALDPDTYSEKVQNDADSLDRQTTREIAKHPDQKDKLETRLRDYQKSASELIEYLEQNGLRPAHLDAGNPELSGWAFFDTDNKWLGGWKPQEEFILRLRLAGKIFEFPLKLPPKEGELLLRKRE